MSDVVIYLSLVALRPAFQGSTLRQHSISRVTQLRVDGSDRSKSGSSAFSLSPTKPGGTTLLFALRCPYRCEYAFDFLKTFGLAVATAEVVGRPTIEKGQIGNEERVLKIGEGGQGGDFGIYSC